MKLKLLKFLTVSLLTLIVLFPEGLICNVIWNKHLQLIEMQRELSGVTISIASHQNTSTIKAFHPDARKDEQECNFDFTSLSKSIALGKWLFLLFPMCLGIFIFLYDRYLVYRATVWQRRVDMLEKLWHESIEQ